MKRERRILLELLERRDAVELRHHDVEQHEVGLVLAHARQRLFAVGRRDHLVAVRLQAHADDIEVLRHVIDGENARRRSHGFGVLPGACPGNSLSPTRSGAGAGLPAKDTHAVKVYPGRNSCTMARIRRGLKGLAT